MFHLTKQSLISFSILIILSLATGWFLVWKVKETNKQSAITVNEAMKQSGEMIKKLQEKNKQETLDLSIDTSNWKAYRNEEYGFEVKYPEEWQIEKYISGTGSDPGEICTEISDTCYVSIGFRNLGKHDYTVIQIIPKISSWYKSVMDSAAILGTTKSGITYTMNNTYDAMSSFCISVVYFTDMSEKNVFTISRIHDEQKDVSYYEAEKFCSKKYEESYFLVFMNNFRFLE